MPDAQVEALRVLVEKGYAAPGELAERLRIARSTVSNLIRSMVAAGLVERSEGADLRTVRITASARAAALLVRYDEASERVLDEALAVLDPADRRAIAAAAPALARLAAAADQPKSG